MKKIFTILIAIAIISLNVIGQNTFQKKISIAGSALDVTSIAHYGIATSGWLLYGEVKVNPSYTFVINTDESGQIVWAKDIDSSLAGAAIKIGERIGGGCYILYPRYINSAISLILATLNSNGDLIWSKSYSIDSSMFFTPTTAKQYPNGDFIMYASGAKLDIIKTDFNGNVKWSKQYTNGANGGRGDIVPLQDGGAVFVGLQGTKSMVVRLDSNGVAIWSKTYSEPNSSRTPCQIINTSDGNFIIAGYTVDYNLSGSYISYIMKIDTSGAMLWYKEYYDPLGNNSFIAKNIIEESNGHLILYDQASVMITDAHGNILSTNMVVFTSATNHWGFNKSYNDDFALCYSSGIDYTYFYKSAGESMLWCDKLSYQLFSPTITYNPTINDTIYQNSSGTSQNYMASITPLTAISDDFCANSGLKEINNKTGISIYPNPNNGTFSVSYPQTYSTLSTNQLIITDVLGNEVLHQSLSNLTNQQINISQWSNGIYFYEVRSGLQIPTSVRGKFVKE